MHSSIISFQYILYTGQENVIIVQTDYFYLLEYSFLIIKFNERLIANIRATKL